MAIVKENAATILKQYIKDNGLKKAFVAEKAGYSPQVMSAILAGRKKFDGDVALRMAKALDVEVGIFLA